MKGFRAVIAMFAALFLAWFLFLMGVAWLLGGPVLAGVYAAVAALVLVGVVAMFRIMAQGASGVEGV